MRISSRLMMALAVAALPFTASTALAQAPLDKDKGAGSIKDQALRTVLETCYELHAEGVPPTFDRVALRIDDARVRALAAKGIQVVDRALLDKLLSELRLGSSELADPDTQLKLGRILAARLTAAGSVRNAENQGQASMRLIDTETTGIALSVSEKMAGAPDPAALAEKMAAEVAKAIRDKYPMKGRIALVDGDTVALNLGKKHGVAVGQQFNVLGKPEPVELNGKILGYKESKVAQLKVTEVQDGLAYAKASDKTGALEKNQRVIQKD